MRNTAPLTGACRMPTPFIGRNLAALTAAENQETLRRSVYQSLQQMGIRGGALDTRSQT